mgnify:CR=1 FL=1
MKPTRKQIWTIAYPILISLLMENMIGLTDTAFLGRVGEVELGASALAGVYYMAIFMLGFGFSIGVQILIARRNGEGRLREIGPIFQQGLLFLLFFAAVMFFVSKSFTPLLLRRLIDSDAVYTAAISYLDWRIYGFFFSFAAVLFRAFYVGTTNTRILTANSVVMVLTNVVLNYILIFGKFGAPEMGVEGAAIATVISRYVELAIVAGWAHSHKARNAFIVGAYRSMYIPGKLLKSITVKGMPLLANEFLWSSGMAVLNQCYSTCGLDVVPAMNICSTLFNLGSVVYLSMGNSVGIIMGQMLGAGHSEEDVRDTNRKLIAVSIASGVMFGGLMAAVSEAFPGIYNTTDAVRHLAAQLIWISAVMMPFGSYLNATYFTLRSGGQTFVTFLFDSCFMWVFCVPLAFCLSRFTNLPILPLYAICQATDFIKCVIGTVMLKQGKWIQNLTV